MIYKAVRDYIYKDVRDYNTELRNGRGLMCLICVVL